MNDKSVNISKHFMWHEVLYLPKWGRCATKEDGLNDEIETNLKRLCAKLDRVRDFFNLPLIVHSGFRPPIYNKSVGGAKNSYHTQGLAMDFHVENRDCDVARAIALPYLETWGLRMEANPGSSWIHMDMGMVVNSRYFKP